MQVVDALQHGGRRPCHPHTGAHITITAATSCHCEQSNHRYCTPVAGSISAVLQAHNMAGGFSHAQGLTGQAVALGILHNKPGGAQMGQHDLPAEAGVIACRQASDRGGVTNNGQPLDTLGTNEGLRGQRRRCNKHSRWLSPRRAGNGNAGKGRR